MKCLTISKAVCQQVSAWGGYVFIINLIPLHVFILLVMGRYSNRLFTSYTTFYILGLLLSMQIPFVGFQPIRTSEHMAASGNVFKSDNACLQVNCYGNILTLQKMCGQWARSSCTICIMFRHMLYACCNSQSAWNICCMISHFCMSVLVFHFEAKSQEFWGKYFIVLSYVTTPTPWDANSHSVGQVLCLLWSLNVHCRVCKNPLLCAVLTQMSSVQPSHPISLGFFLIL